MDIELQQQERKTGVSAYRKTGLDRLAVCPSGGESARMAAESSLRLTSATKFDFRVYIPSSG
jgi:hypothetical protein